MEEYLVPSGEGIDEHTEKRSRFIGHIWRTDTEEEALAAIKATVADGGKVQLIGFGTFESKKREARQGRNPRTGKAVKIKAAVLPVFKAGKAFKDDVNK